MTKAGVAGKFRVEWGPSNSFFERFNSVKWDNSGGMGPVSLLPGRYNVLTWVNWPNSGGMGPDNLLWERLNPVTSL